MTENVREKSMWLKNCWYQVAWSSDLAKDSLLQRIILGTPLVLFRDTEGLPRALLDRCPHRFAPLSAGTVRDGVVRCGYHGLAFNGSGGCVENPHGAVTSAIRASAFAMIERHRALWVWLGDSPPDAAAIPKLTFIDETPDTARIQGYMFTGANYELLTDNILDLSHADYLHPTSLGGMMTTAKTTNRVENDLVTVEWQANDCVPPPAFYSMVHPPQRADIWTQVKWRAPAVMVLGTGAEVAGTPRGEVNVSWTLHNMTPATATSSHYFFCTTRKFNTQDAAFNEMLGGLISNAFQTEDKPMLEKQQLAMGTADLFSLKPVLLSIDTASVRARRILSRLIDEEEGRSMPAPISDATPPINA